MHSNALTCVGNSDDAADDIRTCLRLALTAEALDEVERQGGVVGTKACAHAAPPSTTAAAAHLMILTSRFLGEKGPPAGADGSGDKQTKALFRGLQASLLDR